ncbi:hypothetical protein [uncultured Victivallis sp.]|uniref:glycoside hydrolase 5 family protein n=1 Tax=uncultured Victivallis sp. TaxID=354118 RepID=UPI00259731CF|nr:hypothetical protein [uncultured Victivallis sp.]
MTDAEKPQGIFAPGSEFFVGCNYWASHAGTAMWRDWRPEVVEADFRLLAENGVEVARVFPLWPDFQPIQALTGGGQSFVEMRFGERPLPDTPAGRAGVDEVMVERFRELCRVAEANRIKLIVGLVTGWMSGRMHVPPAFERVNVITDPTAIRWQVRMVRYLVRELRGCPAIAAWDLGNECNCMAWSDSPSEAWCWSNAITSAVRVEDPDRPVVSGMHSLQCERGAWTIQDQGEVTDVLCTHPYPLFTPHCGTDPVNTMRNAFHAAAETRLYGDIGGVPAFVEEAGNLGPSQSSDEVAGNYLRNMLWNCFAHDCRGLLWWCANDQTLLEHAPYDWAAVERELGLLRVDRTPKPTIRAMKAFGEILDRTGLRRLPAFRRDAVVILTQSQDQWGVAYASFLLAKQAGFDVEFQYAGQPLKPSKFYIMPSVSGTHVIPARCYHALLREVENGATLFVSSDGGSLEPFSTVFGIDIATRCKAVAETTIRSEEREFDVRCRAEYQLNLVNRRAEVLAVDIDDDPIFTLCGYGRGKALFLAAPIERAATETPRAFFPEAPELYRLYATAAEAAGVNRRVFRTNPLLTLTEHELDADTLLVIAVNNTPALLTDEITSAPEWVFDSMVWGEPPVEHGFTVQGNAGAILKFRRAR